MKRIFVIIAVLAAGLVGCASGGGGGGGSDNGYTVLEAGSHGAIKEQKSVDIHDQAAFKDLWDKTFANGTVPKMPDIDFTKQTVVAYYLGEMKTGGYVIRVDSVEPSKVVAGNYDVDFLVITPGANCKRTTMEITHPFLIAVVPVTAPITFDMKQRDTPACT